MSASHFQIKFAAIVKRPLHPGICALEFDDQAPKSSVGSPEVIPEPGAFKLCRNTRMTTFAVFVRRCWIIRFTPRSLLSPISGASWKVTFFAVWDFMSLLKRLQQDMTCITVPWFPADIAKGARLVNEIVIGEETDVGPDGSYMSQLALYLRAMRDVGASTRQFEKFRSLMFVGVPVEVALTRIGAPPHVQAFVAHTMALANSGSTEEVLAAFAHGRAGPANRVNSIKARIGFWNGTLNKLRDSRSVERSVETFAVG